jgi:hypothetical protein
VAIPTYKDASKKRISGKCSGLEYFVSEWEPRLTTVDQFEVDRWRDDLSDVVLEFYQDSKQHNNLVYSEYLETIESYQKICVWFMLMLFVSCAVNVFLFFN